MDHMPDQAMPETPHIHMPEDDTHATFCHTQDGPNIQMPTTSQFRLETNYECDEASEITRLLLRALARCRHLSTPVTLALTLQTSLPNCTTQVNVSYIGQALQATLTGAWSSDPLVQATVAEGLSSGPKHTFPHHTPQHFLLIFKTHQVNEDLRVMWDGVAKSVILMTPKIYLILSSGVESKSSEPDNDGDDAQWWRLCVQGWDNSVGGRASSSPHRCQVTAATRPKGDEVVEVLARRHSMTVGHHTRLMKFGVDIQMGGKLQHLLNFTFHNNSHHKGRQQFMLQFPVLQLILEAEVITKRNQTCQYVDILAEIRNLATEATVKFLSWEVTTLHNAGAEDSYCDHNKDVTGDTKSSDGECVSEHCPYTLMEPDPEASPVSGTSTKSKPESENRVQEIRQMVVSDVFNLKSNMTIYASPTGQRIVRIHQDAHSPFCPLLNWSLNQIFNFSKDFSGWEYVVSQWAWGNMVVRGEWGVSPLQWYQKIFSFSLDQAAPLPSTHLILDFRNSSRFLVLVRWPTLATALTASVSIHHSHYTLQVKEVDEFRVENDKVLLEVTAKKNQAGLAFTWTLDAERTTHLYTVATTLLTQASSHPWMCGDSLVRHPISQFLENLLGKDLDHLCATIVLQGWHILQWLRHNLELDQLWEAVREELATSEAQPVPSHGSEKPIQAAGWVYVRAAAERLGVLRDNPEGEGVLFVTKRLLEWRWLAQRLWKLLWMENNDKCPVSCQLSVIVEDLMSQLKHLMLNE